MATRKRGYREHSLTQDTVNSLGVLYANQRKMNGAQAMYRRALEGYPKALGPGHKSTLDTVDNLGNLYANQGKIQEAEGMYRRALDGTEVKIRKRERKPKLCNRRVVSRISADLAEHPEQVI